MNSIGHISLRSWLVSTVALLSLSGCGDKALGDARPGPDAGPTSDVGSTADVGPTADTGPSADVAPTADIGPTADVGSAPDAGTTSDTGPVACTTSSEQLVDGKTTGFAYCDDLLHRSKKVTCPNLLPRAQMPHAPGATVESCKSDADCTAKANGYCQFNSGFLTGQSWSCAYGCLNDQDCGSGFACHCGDPVGTCIATTCTTDADCAPGKLCAAGSGDTNGPGNCAQRLACQTAADQCTRRADCPRVGANPQYCAVGSAGRKCVIAPQDSPCF